MGQETCRERMGVSPADWERQCDFGNILSNRDYGGQSMQGQGDDMHCLYTLETIRKTV